MSLFTSSINPAPAASGGFAFGVSAATESETPPTSGFGVPDGNISTGSSAFGRKAMWTENASKPFGRVESTNKCFARNGEVAITSKWTPPKPPSRPLFQFTSDSNAQDTVPLFGHSTQQQQSKSLFGISGSNSSGNQATVGGGGFAFAPTTNPNTRVFHDNASAGFGRGKTTSLFGNAVDPTFGGTCAVFGNAGNASETGNVDPGFGGTSTVFGCGSSTAKPPLAPSTNPFAVSTKQTGVSLSNPFASNSASASNPFASATPSSSANPFKTPKFAVNPFAVKVSANVSVNPFATSSNTSMNPFAVKVPSNAVNPFSIRNESNTKSFAVPGSVWITEKKSAGRERSASMKFKSGLRPAFKMDGSPWCTGSQDKQQHQQEAVAPVSFDWTGWRKKNESTPPNAKNLFKVPDVSSSEAKSSSSDSPSSPPATSSPPDALVALPDTDPYGSGSFGAGLVEQKIKTAIANPPSSVALKVLDDRSTSALSSSMPRQQPSARFAARLGLARQPLQAVPMRPVQSRFPSRRLHLAPSSARAKPQADRFCFYSSFSRLAISKKSQRLRVEPSLHANTTTGSSRKDEPVDEVAELQTDDKSALGGTDNGTEGTDQDDSESSSPTCPVLLNEEYFTKPSLRELQQLTDDELSGVENFVIGRRNFGKIAFVGATDVRGLQLDELVTFSEGSVVVYPDDSAKPAIGSGLNTPAIVDLHGISAEENESHEDFLNRLESHTQALGATFLGYEDSETGTGGVWSFRVEHF